MKEGLSDIILKKRLYVIVNRNTVSKIFVNHEGILKTLRKMINYVDNVTNEKSNTNGITFLSLLFHDYFFLTLWISFFSF